MSLCWEYVCAFCMFWILTIFEFCAKSVTILENLIHFKADEGASRKLPTIWRLFLEKSLYFGIMRVWLSLFTIINIIHIKMPLIKTVLKHIQDCEPNVNRREALVKTLLLAPKLAKHFERISFLVECRKAHTLSRFIQDIMARTSIISSRDNFIA